MTTPAYTRKSKALRGLPEPEETEGPGEAKEVASMPKTRGECIGQPRPCPWVRCRHHLALEVRGATVFLAHGTDDVDACPETCSLDVADEGEHTLEAVSVILSLSRERIRQIEAESVWRFKQLCGQLAEDMKED